MSNLTLFAFARLVEDFERRYRVRAICHPDNEAELRQMFEEQRLDIVIKPLPAMVLDTAIVIEPANRSGLCGPPQYWLIDMKRVKK